MLLRYTLNQREKREKAGATEGRRILELFFKAFFLQNMIYRPYFRGHLGVELSEVIIFLYQYF